MGDGATPTGQFVRVHPHIGPVQPTGLTSKTLGGNATFVEKVDDELGTGPTSLGDGVWQVTLDNSKAKAEDGSSDFLVANREDSARCMPRDLCYYDDSSMRCRSCFEDGAPRSDTACIRADALAVDAPDWKTQMQNVCNDWVTWTAGEQAPTDVALADCPAGGCIGFAFTVPEGLSPQPYQQVAAASPKACCYPEADVWNVSLTKSPTSFCETASIDPVFIGPGCDQSQLCPFMIPEPEGWLLGFLGVAVLAGLRGWRRRG